MLVSDGNRPGPFRMMTKQRRYKRTTNYARRRRRVRRNRRILLAAVIGAAVLILVPVLCRNLNGTGGGETAGVLAGEEDGRPPLDVQLLTPNEYSRPQIPLENIRGIVIHYTANPGSSAQANRNYFEGLQDGAEEIYASSHFIIGLEGEIIQCIPSTEISYASNDRNEDTLSIECCHPDEEGSFTDETYQSLVELTAWLCHHFEVPVQNVIRHYDVTGKECPKYFVDHEDAWEQFKTDVEKQLEQLETSGEE